MEIIEKTKNKEVVKEVSKQEEFYRKFNVQVDFSDLKKKFEEEKPGFNIEKDDILGVIPEKWELKRALKMMKIFFRVEDCSILNLNNIREDKRSDKNYAFIFSLNNREDDNDSYKPITLTERIMLELFFFTRKNFFLDEILDKIILCPGSKKHIKCDNVDNNLYPFLNWNSGLSRMEIDYSPELNNFLEIKKVKVIK